MLVLLIDFCGLGEFKDRNFNILAVSLDTERKLWLDAVKKDKLLWTQLSDSNVLISPEGKIIARNYVVRH